MCRSSLHIQASSYVNTRPIRCAWAGNAGNVFPATPDMHHGTCVTHLPWCMLGSITSSFLCSRWRVKRSRHSRRMRNPQFYVSGRRPMISKMIASIAGGHMQNRIMKHSLIEMWKYPDVVFLTSFVVLVTPMHEYIRHGAPLKITILMWV